MRQINKQAGVALALILWFIAALSLLVAGLMSLSRAEVSNARLYLAQAQAAAAGDGVALLVSRGLYRQEPSWGSALTGQQPFEGYATSARIVPADGLVDVLTAEAELLYALFETMGELEPAQARALADSVLQWRAVTDEQKTQTYARPKAYVLEDVMHADGFTRLVFERLKWAICAACNQGRLNWQHAPVEVKSALANTAWSEVSADAEEPSEWLQMPGVGRVDVRVKMSDNSVFQRSVWVSSGGVAARRHSPFRVKQLEFKSNDRGQ